MLTTLPSGLAGDVRGLSAKDLRYLTSEKLVRDNEVEDYVLRNAWTSMSDAGPYAFQGPQGTDWPKVLVGDRVAALISIRCATFPSRDYPAKLKCAGCGRTFEYDFDLSALLREGMKKLKPEDQAAFKNGNVFHGTIPGTERDFDFKLRLGEDAKRLQRYLDSKKNGSKQMQERVNYPVDAITSHITRIDGLEKQTYDARFDFVESLSLPDFQELAAFIQGHDCGVETSVSVDCSRCGYEQEVELPFAQRGFFDPKGATKKRVTGSSIMDEEQGPEDATSPDP